MKSHYNIIQLMTFHKVDTVNCCCFLDISIYSFLYVAASNQQTPVFKA
jgi:hypothetical protein